MQVPCYSEDEIRRLELLKEKSISCSGSCNDNFSVINYYPTNSDYI